MERYLNSEGAEKGILNTKRQPKVRPQTKYSTQEGGHTSAKECRGEGARFAPGTRELLHHAHCAQENSHT